MLVEIPEGTVDDDTLEDMLRSAIEDYSVELANRINLCIDRPNDECDVCNEMEEEELYEQRLVLCADGIRPDEAQTVIALIAQVVEDSRFGIAGTVLDDYYDEESAESSENDEDEDEDEDWDVRDV